jgi:hypothetical protein
MNKYEILDKVKAVASDISGVDKDKLSMSTSINNDLKIDGDDIEDLIRLLDKEFHLNYEGFDFSRYFNSENEIRPVLSIFNKILNKNIPKKSTTYDVTIGDFVDWAYNGYWKES